MMKYYKRIDEKRYANKRLFVIVYKSEIFNNNTLTLYKNKRTIQP